MTETSFDFDSGHLILDFANTKIWRDSEKPEERLNSYADIVAWGEAAQLLSTNEAELLRELAEQNPAEATVTFQQTIRLREAIYSIFSKRYTGAPISAQDLEVLNTTAREAIAHLHLVLGEDKARWEWVPEINVQKRVLWTVGRAATELLTSDIANRIRECEDDRGCGYLFIDQSKNRSRRWCSMESCGNRAKARRHYARTKG